MDTLWVIWLSRLFLRLCDDLGRTGTTPYEVTLRSIAKNLKPCSEAIRPSRQTELLHRALPEASRGGYFAQITIRI